MFVGNVIVTAKFISFQAPHGGPDDFNGIHKFPEGCHIHNRMMNAGQHLGGGGIQYRRGANRQGGEMGKVQQIKAVDKEADEFLGKLQSPEKLDQFHQVFPGFLEIACFYFFHNCLEAGVLLNKGAVQLTGNNQGIGYRKTLHGQYPKDGRLAAHLRQIFIFQFFKGDN